MAPIIKNDGGNSTSVAPSQSSISSYLSNLVTNSSFSTTLGSYVTSSSLSTTLGSYALSSALSAYETTSALSTTLGNYVTNSSLSSTLSSYVLSSALSAYETTSALSTTLGNYVTNSSLSSTLSSYVLSSALSAYETTSALATTLGNYVTNSSLSATLSSYALSSALSAYETTSALATTLSDYVTNTSLSSTLSSYETKSALTTTLGCYIPQTISGSNYWYVTNVGTSDIFDATIEDVSADQVRVVKRPNETFKCITSYISPSGTLPFFTCIQSGSTNITNPGSTSVLSAQYSTYAQTITPSVTGYITQIGLLFSVSVTSNVTGTLSVYSGSNQLTGTPIATGAFSIGISGAWWWNWAPSTNGTTGADLPFVVSGNTYTIVFTNFSVPSSSTKFRYITGSPTAPYGQGYWNGGWQSNALDMSLAIGTSYNVYACGGGSTPTIISFTNNSQPISLSDTGSSNAPNGEVIYNSKLNSNTKTVQVFP